jgi:hypothetical protein
MAGARRSEVEMNLFPFMSVLIALMGVMVFFLIAIVSTRAIGDAASDGSLSRDATIPARQHAEVVGQIGRLTALVSQRQQQCRQLREECEQLREDIATRRNELEMGSAPGAGRTEGVVLGEPEGVNMVPDPKGRPVTKAPVFVEIQTEKFLVHREKAEYPAEQLADANSDLRKFLDSVDRACDKEYLILLVHPGGIPAHDRLRACLVKDYGKTVPFEGQPTPTTRIDVGVEPFSPYWSFIASQQGSSTKKK